MSKRFLPSIEQIKKAADELPDPMAYSDDSCSITLKVGEAKRDLSFSRVKFNAGKSESIYRWVYEGKVLMRTKKERAKAKKSDSDSKFSFSISLR